MAHIKCISNTKSSCYLHSSNNNSFLIEYPGDLYGSSFKVPTLQCPAKPIFINIPDIKPYDITKVFVCSSDSLGIFFLQKNISVYITEPVFDQLVLKLNFYKKLKVNYQENSFIGKIRNIKKSKIPTLVKIRLNQSINLNDCLIKAVVAGSNVGWVNFLIEEKFKFFYAKSLNTKKRISEKLTLINPDYLFLIRNCNSSSLENLHCFCKEECTDKIPGLSVKSSLTENFNLKSENLKFKNKELIYKEKIKVKFSALELLCYLRENRNKKNIVIAEFNSFFVDLLFLLFSDLVNVPIYVLSTDFEFLIEKLNFSGEFMSDFLKNRIYKGEEPLPFNLYSYFKCISSTKSIIHTNYILFTSTYLHLPETTAISINCFAAKTVFFISYEMSLEEIKNIFACTTFVIGNLNFNCPFHSFDSSISFFADKPFISTFLPENFKFLPTNQSIFISSQSSMYEIEVVNTQFGIINQNSFLFEGKIISTDVFNDQNIKHVLRLKQLEIQRLFLEERYFCYNGWYYFSKQNVRIRIGEKIEIERFIFYN